LLVPILRRGQVVYDFPTIHDVRTRATEQIARLHPTIRRLVNLHGYPAPRASSSGCNDLQTRLLLQPRGARIEDAH
jgi:nicotinate phosphoribosyltransferase